MKTTIIRILLALSLFFGASASANYHLLSDRLYEIVREANRVKKKEMPLKARVSLSKDHIFKVIGRLTDQMERRISRAQRLRQSPFNRSEQVYVPGLSGRGWTDQGLVNESMDLTTDELMALREDAVSLWAVLNGEVNRQSREGKAPRFLRENSAKKLMDDLDDYTRDLDIVLASRGKGDRPWKEFLESLRDLARTFRMDYRPERIETTGATSQFRANVLMQANRADELKRVADQIEVESVGADYGLGEIMQILASARSLRQLNPSGLHTNAATQVGMDSHLDRIIRDAEVMAAGVLSQPR